MKNNPLPVFQQFLFTITGSGLVWSVDYSLLTPALERYLRVGRPEIFLQKTVFVFWGFFGGEDSYLVLMYSYLTPQRAKS